MAKVRRAIPPRQLLLIDGLGALLSAALLRILPDVGVPDPVITALSWSALALAGTSLSGCRTPHPRPGHLRLVASFNRLYCLATLSVMVAYRATISWLGIAYFLLEIVIISQLVRVESRAAALIPL